MWCSRIDYYHRYKVTLLEVRTSSLSRTCARREGRNRRVRTLEKRCAAEESGGLEGVYMRRRKRDVATEVVHAMSNTFVRTCPWVPVRRGFRACMDY
jgi:hypothetical protein